ncbi:Fibrinogen-like protein A,Ryncolin-4,Angiopoietin-related protein 7,Ficolin-3,Ficolin-1-B,Ficolin-2,Ryncolin-1,Tenascin-R,Fibrinogen-like protein 1,Fibrinogen C domain-containing protein 1-A,Ryncolin-3,Tenascin,Fibrinogen C domain-containing protein 1,Ryncolin-2,Techylectin-5B,Angiopoietin-2,Fibrinogen alpha chain,Ficolin-1-A,Ficolin-1,Fibrinogen C domain-containing protein 1-B,Angiopoietin-4 [Mytilus coruscus]|uniref:Fibrinogen C-terminal domain-containing protein n=1 Tax=Mytilus coruscus TaxID=42192 RepID=A0A6J8AF05_MYTCO|nr:Fibrinogen-like protein A,Ryncolin-4,Angiopoietin-related protein 7,Ficolin-3,Ficolin-1-B,Ficolin-2,Ryncolin-1,Tenascin-R,Fibrinogen-like protein 1,Fibrinogen C domain-containing protein 1-A,Ryncolin-3,Tenascin,Fibrinogen C domain-containing protein 1,Ryncolin-2,Techylectin-5B,Angiopoietin-2,Fibrinogen alpha chain,Ficolin-1-A,Ficolin-1,Fibrinogen C domain-containing protein 1-B,Angiopoietin-4 [Mytilus coruscus]
MISNVKFSAIRMFAAYDVTTLNDPISREEIIKAVESAKVRTATGFDKIPAEVLKNPTAVELLFVICNGCFELGKVPEQWTTGIINLIFKTGSDDRKNPMNYRGITLVSVPSKIYCHVLNSRLNEWMEANKTLCDEQNSFREKRSCEEHIHTFNKRICKHCSITGICLKEHHFKTVKELKKDTQAILNSLSVYKEVVKMNRQVTNDIKWIMKGICGMSVVKDCTDFQKTKQKSGVYTIYPDKSGSVKAYCDMAPETGGGWTIIQRRYDGSVNFQRTWSEYENGFGNANGEYWLGNKYIHRLTSSGTYELKVVLISSSKTKGFALYKTFVVGDAASKYTLTVGGYSGNAGDSLAYHNNMQFSTTDQDNDKSSSKCVTNFGPWWHNDCNKSGLNKKLSTGLYWFAFDQKCSKSVMMIRRIY